MASLSPLLASYWVVKAVPVVKQIEPEPVFWRLVIRSRSISNNLSVQQTFVRSFRPSRFDGHFCSRFFQLLELHLSHTRFSEKTYLFSSPVILKWFWGNLHKSRCENIAECFSSHPSVGRSFLNRTYIFFFYTGKNSKFKLSVWYIALYVLSIRIYFTFFFFNPET